MKRKSAMIREKILAEALTQMSMFGAHRHLCGTRFSGEKCNCGLESAYVQTKAALAMFAQEPDASTRSQKLLMYDSVRLDGRLERFCEHGIGHTVGHLDLSKLKSGYTWIHGCDGCCANYEKMSDK